MHSEYLDKLDVAFRLIYDKRVSDQEMKSIVTKAFLNKEEIKTLALTGNVGLSTRKTNMEDGVISFTPGIFFALEKPNKYLNIICVICNMCFEVKLLGNKIFF